MILSLLIYIVSFAIAYKFVAKVVFTSSELDADAWKLLAATTVSSIAIDFVIGGTLGLLIRIGVFYLVCLTVGKLDAVNATWLAIVWTFMLFIMHALISMLL